MFYLLFSKPLSNIIISFSYCYTSEQGRRNNLISNQQKVAASDQDSTKLSTTQSLPTDEQRLSPFVIVISDSVHCNPLTQFTVSSGFSCHTIDNLSEKDDVESSLAPNRKPPPPSWVHVFSKSSSTTSLRTQCAAAAYLDVKSAKVLHRRSRCAKKKQRKIEQLLREVIVPPDQLKLTSDEIDSEIIVFDGGDTASPRIKPPDGILWRCISVRLLHVEDEPWPNIGLCFPKIDGVHPFIRMPHQMALAIIAEFGLEKITNSLTACKMLRRTALGRGDSKRVFTDYGKRVSYACAGPQPSRNNTVRSHPPFMDALSDSHWRSLVWMMKRAENSFRLIVDHSVLSHLHHAKKLVPFKTFTSSKADHPSDFNAQFFGDMPKATWRIMYLISS